MMKKSKKIVRIPLQEYSRFHFGELKLDDNLALSTTSAFAHSDTLFSALVHSYSKYKGTAETFIDYFKNGQLKISSLFYYLKNNEQFVYFLPKPSFITIDSEKKEDGSHKRINRIAFVSVGVWNNGFEMDKWFDKTQQEYIVIDKKFVMTVEEYLKLELVFEEKEKLKIYRIDMSPKSPQRSNVKAAIFYQADVQIAGKYCSLKKSANDLKDKENDFEIGWYFLYDIHNNDEPIETELKIATNIMAYTGIGGEIHNTGRSIKSLPEFGDALSFHSFGQNTSTCNLSLLYPSEEEFHKVKYYKDILRGGRKSSKGGVKVVRMIKEGALITSNNPIGQVVPDMGTDKNDNTIVRNGIALLIPVKYES